MEIPASQQWEDFKTDLSSVENWENTTAFGVTFFAGGYGVVSKTGTLSKGVAKVGRLGEPSVTVFRGINTDAGVAYQRGLKGIVKPRGGIFGHSDPLLHNSGLNGTINSRFTSWTTNPDVAMNYALRTSGQGLILRVRVPVSRLVKSPNLKNVLLKHKGIRVSESEVLLEGTIRRNVEVIKVKENLIKKK